jgi:hypothetical protein
MAAYLASILVSAPFFYHLAHGSQAYLGLLEDDYFYYAIVADNLLTQGRLTYDETTLTNGFHPLWFVVLASLRALCGSLGPAFYVTLTLVSLASMFVTFELGRQFAGKLGASPALAGAIAAVYSVGTAQLLTNGMESVVAVPLLLWLLVEIARPGAVTSRRAAKVGFVASLAILGRLDLAIAVALLIVGFTVLVRPPLAVFSRLLLAFCAGGLLVPLYAAANLHFFGSPFPVSALAKQLVMSPGFNLTYAKRVALGTVYGPTVSIVLPLGLVALLLLIRRDGLERPVARFAGALALGFAFVFFGVNASTGWIFFAWYAYPIAAATIAALVLICDRWAPGARGRTAAALAATLLVALAPVLAARHYIEHGPRWSVADNSLLAMSYELAGRVRGRHGRFAMGAIAGVATYVMDKPVLQLEGIMADHRLVEHIRRQDPLDEVLRAYQVDYLVVSLASASVPHRDGCYLVTQPNAEWAGARTAKMRGEICTEPIEHFVTPRGPNRWSRFSAIETFVWDVRTARWRTREATSP